MKDVVEFEINEKISDNELLDLIEKYKENKNIKKEQCKYCDFFDKTNDKPCPSGRGKVFKIF